LSITLDKTPRFEHATYARLLKLNVNEAEAYIEKFAPKKEEVKMPTKVEEKKEFSDEDVRKVLISKYEEKFGKKPF
jgi:cytoskeletal protein RodZ